MPENEKNSAEVSTGARRRCRDIMTRNVTTAAPEMVLREVAALLRETLNDGPLGLAELRFEFTAVLHA